MENSNKVTIVFNQISDDEIERYLSASNVFNIDYKSLMDTHIYLYSFEDERLGYSKEKLDVVLLKDGEYELLDSSPFDDYTDIPLSFLLSNENFDSVLVVIRRMSNVILDTVSGNVTSYIYNVMPDKFSDIKNNNTLSVTLAKNKVYINTENTEEICDRITNNEFIDDYTKEYLINELKKYWK